MMMMIRIKDGNFPLDLAVFTFRRHTMLGKREGVGGGGYCVAFKTRLLAMTKVEANNHWLQWPLTHDLPIEKR